jgi:hypothetical protein
MQGNPQYTIILKDSIGILIIKDYKHIPLMPHPKPTKTHPKTIFLLIDPVSSFKELENKGFLLN